MFIIFFCFFGILNGKEYPHNISLEEILSGFDDEDEPVDINANIKFENNDNSPSNLYGNTGLKLSYSYNREGTSKNEETDWGGITKFQTFSYLKFDFEIGDNWKSRISGKVSYDFAFGFKGRENFSQEVLI